MKNTVAFIFFDTCFALHFKRPDQIDWKLLTGSHDVVLVAAPVFLNGLDYEKVYNLSPVLRERARLFSSWLVDFIRNPGLPVRVGTRWLFLQDEQIQESDFHQFVNVADDQLVASALAFSQQEPGRVIVATDNVALEAKLRHKNIEPLSIPDWFRLPSGSDLQELRRAIALRPEASLALTAFDDTNILNLHLTEMLPRSDETLLNEMLARYPEAIASRAGGLPHGAVGDVRSLDSRSEREELHGKERELFLAQYSSFLDEVSRFNQANSLTGQIVLILVNDGPVSATDIEVRLSIPPEVDAEFVRIVDLPKRPQKPELPAVVRAEKELLVTASSSQINSQKFVRPNGHPNTIMHVQSARREIRLQIDDIKASCGKILDMFFVRFQSASAVRSFKLPFTISARDISQQVSGEFNAVIVSTRVEMSRPEH